ncbi:MAG TPA: FadR/GntR family transcriptional regulator [Sphingomonas sp.]|jgi:DNA-binding FadR family transcriptional regulator|nr:FadR/GntR family transcriptional regulator [Sphingomonas sp.]
MKTADREGVVSTTKAASLADKLVALLEQEIHQGAMPPGARFPTEKALAAQFEVSRTVVREAFARLVAQGLIVSRRGSGAFVAEDATFRAFQVTPDQIATLEDVIVLLELRVGFEAEMAELAAVRHTPAQLETIRSALNTLREAGHSEQAAAADAAFHVAIAQATANEYFVRFTEFLGARLVPSRQLYLGDGDSKSARRYAKVIDRDHERIFAAIAARNGPGAGRAARQHILNSIARHKGRIAVAATLTGPER